MKIQCMCEFSWLDICLYIKIILSICKFVVETSIWESSCWRQSCWCQYKFGKIHPLKITTATQNLKISKRVQFVEESPTVIIYPEQNAYDADEWGEGFYMTYEEYRRNVKQ